MDSDPVELTIICDNCHAMNLSNATVCGACGVNLRHYRETLPRIQNYQNEKAQEHIQSLNQKSQEYLKTEIRYRKRLLNKQIQILLFLSLVGAVIVSAVATVGAIWYYSRQVKIEDTNRAAAACLEAEDYICARIQYQELLRLSPGYPGAQDGLNRSRIGLAGEYLESGLWESAIFTLDEYLEDMPGDPQALEMMRDAYDAWILEKFTNRDYLGGLMLQVQRDLRFDNDQ